MEQEIHPVLGISRPNGEHPKRCSKCGTEIGEDDVPLMLFDDQAGRECRLWVYCTEHSNELMRRLVPATRK